MNDQKTNDIIKPKISTELDDGDNKLYTFDSSHSKSFTFENGQLKEHNENETVGQGDEYGYVLKTTDKSTQFQKPLPPTPNEKGKVNNNNNNNINNSTPLTNIKTTTTNYNYDNNTVTTNTSNSKTPYNTPNQKYQTLEEAHNNPVDFSRFKDSISKIQDPKKESDINSGQTSSNDPNKQIADNLGLKHINKNPNVGNEQFFTSFQKYATNNNSKSKDPLPNAAAKK